ncbi:MAG: hypothetical protein IPO52_07090 [Gemmatimonadetes bacterium]|nr:hypothetical protein [Gemmatimonadota bacterium]
MKIAVVVPVALVLGLGLGTAAGRMLHPPEAPAAEHDSSGAEAKDSLKPETAPHEGEKPAEAPAADGGHAAMTPVPLDATPAPVTTTPVVPAGTKATPAADVQRMAKIFDRLPAADAAALVAQMSDAELEGVLRTMDVAKAGDLIAALPKPRGAALSKRLLAPPAKP